MYQPQIVPSVRRTIDQTRQSECYHYYYRPNGRDYEHAVQVNGKCAFGEPSIKVMHVCSPPLAIVTANTVRPPVL